MKAQRRLFRSQKEQILCESSKSIDHLLTTNFTINVKYINIRLFKYRNLVNYVIIYSGFEVKGKSQTK